MESLDNMTSAKLMAATACEMCGTQVAPGATVCPYCGNDLATDIEVRRMVAARMAAAYRKEEPAPAAEEPEEAPEATLDEAAEIDAPEEALDATVVAPVPVILPEAEEAPAEEAPAVEEPVTEAPIEQAPVEAAPAEEAPAEEASTEEAVAEELPAEEAPAEEPVTEAPVEEAPIEEAPAEEAPAAEEPAEETPAEEPAPEVIPEVLLSKRDMKHRLGQIANGQRFAYAVTPPPAVFPDAPGPYPVGYEKLNHPKDPMLRHCLSLMQDDVDCLLAWMRETGGVSELYDPIVFLDDLEKCEAYLVTLFPKEKLCKPGDRKREAALLAYCKRQVLKGYTHCMAFKERNLPLIEAVKQHYAKSDLEDMKYER